MFCKSIKKGLFCAAKLQKNNFLNHTGFIILQQFDMNFKLFYIAIIFSAALVACNSTNDANKQKIADDISKSGCYNIANEKIAEVLNIVIDEKGISGTGKRSYTAFNENFDLSINGKKNKDGSFEMSITAKSTMQGRENVSETTYETWNFTKNTLEVSNRNSSHFVGNLSFVKVNCDGSSQKDTMLFDAFLGFHEGYAAVVKNGKWGVVNKNWKLVVPCQYDELGNVSEGAVKFYLREKGKYGILDITANKTLIEAEYIHVTNFSEGYAAVLDDKAGRWGIINRKGEMIEKPKYWSVSFFPQNPYLMLFNEGMANVAIDDAKWGYIDTNLKNVIPFQYIFAEAFKGGMARVNKNGKDWFYIDKTGKCVKDCP